MMKPGSMMKPLTAEEQAERRSEARWVLSHQADYTSAEIGRQRDSLCWHATVQALEVRALELEAQREWLNEMIDKLLKRHPEPGAWYRREWMKRWGSKGEATDGAIVDY